MNTKFSRLPGSDKAIMIFAYAILGLFMAAIILPVVYIILASFIDPITLQNSGLTFDFSKWTLTAYERVMTNAQIWTGLHICENELCPTLQCKKSSLCRFQNQFQSHPTRRRSLPGIRRLRRRFSFFCG